MAIRVNFILVLLTVASIMEWRVSTAETLRSDITADGFVLQGVSSMRFAKSFCTSFGTQRQNCNIDVERNIKRTLTTKSYMMNAVDNAVYTHPTLIAPVDEMSTALLLAENIHSSNIPPFTPNLRLPTDRPETVYVYYDENTLFRIFATTGGENHTSDALALKSILDTWCVGMVEQWVEHPKDNQP
ncbi:MAG: hypothetical protein EOP48_29405 [Sphingobacteriales bacterium]|nr:MAG: hypothetical protein EOP48_29405 [Sphingobacteriales bacterium]